MGVTVTDMGQRVTDVGSEQKLVKHELKKHAATIHCSNTLSLLQRKISNALLYFAYPNLMLREEHEITIKQLCNLISYNGNNHAVIKDALKGLLSTVIEWNVVDDMTGSEDWSASSILASVSLRGPICLYAYSPRMKALLHSPSMFGKINLFIQSRFKSNYGLALYENCIRYRGLPHTKWFEMDLFRKLMGVPTEKYTVFRDFKRRVLDKSIEEVNTYSDLIIEPEILREGRQVVKVRFNLKERAKKIRLGTPLIETTAPINDPREEMKAKLITQYHLSVKQVEKILKDYAPDFILAKMALVESSTNYQKGQVKNIAAYFISALKHNYQPPKSSDQGILKIKQQKKSLQMEEEELQRIIKRLKNKYQTVRESQVDQAIEALADNIKKDLLEKFYQVAAPSIATILKLQRRRYSEATILKSPSIRALLRQFALQTLPELHTQVISLTDFISTLPDKQQRAWEYSQMEKKGYNEIV